LPIQTAYEAGGPILANESLLDIKPRVLVVDDLPDAADSLAWLLPLVVDCTVHVAYSGPEALEIADRVHPQVVILDISMRQMNGYQMADLMRQRAWGEQAFLVALSGWDMADIPGHPVPSSSINLHLKKPVDVDTLRDVLGQLCAA